MASSNSILCAISRPGHFLGPAASHGSLSKPAIDLRCRLQGSGCQGRFASSIQGPDSCCRRWQALAGKISPVVDGMGRVRPSEWPRNTWRRVMRTLVISLVLVMSGTAHAQFGGWGNQVFGEANAFSQRAMYSAGARTYYTHNPYSGRRHGRFYRYHRRVRPVVIVHPHHVHRDRR